MRTVTRWGEWLANRHEQGKSVRARLRGKTQKDKAYDYYADRSMVEHEFDMLWNKQSEINPALFTENARTELKDILLFQRPLKPVKPGRCTLLPDEERAPRALPIQQKFRIYQEVNNLRILDENLTEQPLSIEQRDSITDLLEGGDVTFNKIRKTLRLHGTVKFNLEDVKRDRLKGNETSKVLAKPQYFGKAWNEFTFEKQNQIVDLLLNEASEQKLIEWLQSNTGVDEQTAEKIANTTLPEGYGNLSIKALDRILPELIKCVTTYSEAVEQAGLGSHSNLSHAGQTGEVMDALPYYGEMLIRHVGFGTGDPDDLPDVRFGKIANPTVHIGLNQLRRVVNALIKRYGHPGEIIVEVARDLKLSRQQKLDIQREQSSRQQRNNALVDDACEVLGLNPATIDKSKRRDLSQRMQLWVELNPADVTNRRCPYTGEQISIARLLSSDVEIEHILPYSRTLDDSMNNKTVAMRQANKDKGNRTPYEAFGENNVDGYDYEAIINRAALMPSAKKKRFAVDGYQQWLKNDKDFLARALTDTAYFSRIAKEYLSLICPPNKVRAIPGRMTALLRGKYRLNELLSGSEQKNRDDHRHHAIDAAVIAITDQGLLQRFAKASARAEEKQLNKLVEDMPQPWPTYREHVARAINNVIVSHKPDHGYQGAIHEDTAWGIRQDGMASRLVKDGQSEIRTRVTKKQKLVPINSTNDLHRHGRDETGDSKAYKGYIGGSNYCIEFVQDNKGKWTGEVISTFDAYGVIREYGEQEGYRKLRDPDLSQSGKPLGMRLNKGDMVYIPAQRGKQILRVVKIKSNGTIYLAEHFEANADARDRDTDNPYGYTAKSAGSFNKSGGRAVVVSELGDLRFISSKVK